LPSLPASFRGVIRITAGTPINVIGLRGTYNERGDFLVTTTPPANEDTPMRPDFQLMFPHVVSGGGYTTEVTLFNAGGRSDSAGNVYVRSRDGAIQPSASVSPAQ
jgi:hypothetical protein